MSFKLLRNRVDVSDVKNVQKPYNISMFYTKLNSGMREDRINDRMNFGVNNQVYDVEYTGYETDSEQHIGKINGGNLAWIEPKSEQHFLEPKATNAMAIRQQQRLIYYGRPKTNLEGLTYTEIQ